ncbi:hypothetical protein RRG08_049694 [Elysia crispata]|uniref:Uncharacterized protein n=1 Tax=Elysia crispata TaxID=231223 RepID=A0AAE1DMY1_9GAST|nr:hypothetical protein RRG08_049694 [Elysia crispata]
MKQNLRTIPHKRMDLETPQAQGVSKGSPGGHVVRARRCRKQSRTVTILSRTGCGVPKIPLVSCALRCFHEFKPQPFPIDHERYPGSMTWTWAVTEFGNSPEPLVRPYRPP